MSLGTCTTERYTSACNIQLQTYISDPFISRRQGYFVTKFLEMLQSSLTGREMNDITMDAKLRTISHLAPRSIAIF